MFEKLLKLSGEIDGKDLDDLLNSYSDLCTQHNAVLSQIVKLKEYTRIDTNKFKPHDFKHINSLIENKWVPE